MVRQQDNKIIPNERHSIAYGLGPVRSANNQRRPNVSVGRKNRTYIDEIVFLFRLVTITGTGRIYSPVRSIHHRTSGTPRFIGVSGTFQVQPAEHAEPSNDHDGYAEFD